MLSFLLYTNYIYRYLNENFWKLIFIHFSNFGSKLKPVMIMIVWKAAPVVYVAGGQARGYSSHPLQAAPVNPG